MAVTKNNPFFGPSCTFNLITQSIIAFIILTNKSHKKDQKLSFQSMKKVFNYVVKS